MQRELRVGDFVTWRSNKRPNLLGIRNCEVVEVGRVDDEGRPAAKIVAFGQECGALVEDLEIEG